MRVVCERLSKIFSSREGAVAALRGVSLTVADGEFVCVVGPSGCGKTTLLRLIAGLLRPTSGQVTRETDPDDGRPDTAFVFQQHGLFPWMTVIDNVAFGLRMRRVSRSEARERSAVALTDVGLASFLHRFPHELSGGMRQRVSIARALLANPHVLLMDEPFAWLDALTKVALQQELVETWTERGCGVLYVTHDIEEAIRLGDRLVVMTGGDGAGGRIDAEFRVDLIRPRDLVGPLPAAATEITRRVWAILEDDVRRRLAIAR
jgi:NitT/TauT family transport system ATP-binding protein